MENRKSELPLKQEVFEVVGCAMEVLNALGHGFHEKPYENALAVEFDLRDISYRQQPRYEVRYKENTVGEYVPDLIAYGRLVVDTKVIEEITHHELGKMINYLRITDLKVGLILNFKRPRLDWQRVVL